MIVCYTMFGCLGRVDLLDLNCLFLDTGFLCICLGIGVCVFIEMVTCLIVDCSWCLLLKCVLYCVGIVLI